jgi:hypothetical protein
LQNAVEFLANLMIPKSQHNYPLATQEFQARSMANLSDVILMPATVQFDRKLCSRTVKIQGVAVQRMLPTKFATGKISVPQIAKECAQCQLPSFPTNERDSRRIILVPNAIFEKQDYHPSPQSSPRKRGEARDISNLGY